MRTVTRVLDGETLSLDDGSEVRLIGALAPRYQDAAAAPGKWPPETEAIDFLSTLSLGKRVRLGIGKGKSTDRYARYLAHVFVDDDAGGSTWLQGALLEAGQARAYALPGLTDCLDELLAHESEARRNRRGLWRNGIYRAKPAARAGGLMRLRNRYERVEGVVVTVTTTRASLYLNFGADWKSDFTVRVAKPVLDANPSLSTKLEALKGRRIAVRGWIERRNGPMMDIVDGGQIEILDGGAPGVALDGPVPDDTAKPAAPAGGGAPAESGAPKRDRPGPAMPSPGGFDL